MTEEEQIKYFVKRLQRGLFEAYEEHPSLILSAQDMQIVWDICKEFCIELLTEDRYKYLTIHRNESEEKERIKEQIINEYFKEGEK